VLTTNSAIDRVKLDSLDRSIRMSLSSLRNHDDRITFEVAILERQRH